MHQWTAYASEAFSTSRNFWQLQVPLMALEHPQVMDSLMSISALHLSKSSATAFPVYPGPSASSQVPSYQDKDRNLAQRVATLSPGPVGSETLHSQSDVSGEDYTMLINSRIYLDRAIEGHRLSLSNELTLQNIEAVYATATLISSTALFTLSNQEDDPTLPPLDATLWARLAANMRDIAARWRELAGENWMTFSAIFDEKPDMHDEVELFRPEHAAPFAALLAQSLEYELLPGEDQKAYQQTVSYLGLTYTNILNGTDDHLATCRRILTLPACCPPRFIGLVAERQPRAIAILVHIFAVMKLIDSEAVWFRGIAERQIPSLYEGIAPEWKEMLHWPLSIITGDQSALSKESAKEG
ncbi:hypothetical protein MBLNU230_g0946t1 [Neophaeotheca triangularis]